MQKKRGTRVADLETKLTRAQEELKKLREQLVSTEAAKKEAQEALEEAKKRIPAAVTSPQNSEEEKPPLPLEEETETGTRVLDSQEKSEQTVEKELADSKSEEESVNSLATDVFEVVAKSEKEEEETKAMMETALSYLLITTAKPIHVILVLFQLISKSECETEFRSL